MTKQIEIYQSEDGQTQIALKLEQDTLWLSQAQLAELFSKDVRTINEHIKNIFKSGELDRDTTIRKFRIVRKEGSREVKRQIEHYNLDVAISVGYRVNSLKGTQFRIWATQRLKEYLVQGFTINQQRFNQNAKELEQAIKLIEKAAKSDELTKEAGRGLVEIVSRYTQTFLWLQRYDEGLLETPQGQTGGQLPSISDAKAGLQELKQQLIERGEATALFANPKDKGGLDAILGNLEQSVFGEPAYPTIESKAAHLLYFVVMYRMYCMLWLHGCRITAKNHPFSDGNKRSGAFLFVDFLHRNKRLFNAENHPTINDTGLAALTLLVAESDPKQKDIIIKLIMNMLSSDKS